MKKQKINLVYQYSKKTKNYMAYLDINNFVLGSGIEFKTKKLVKIYLLKHLTPCIKYFLKEINENK